MYSVCSIRNTLNYHKIDIKFVKYRRFTFTKLFSQELKEENHFFDSACCISKLNMYFLFAYEIVSNACKFDIQFVKL